MEHNLDSFVSELQRCGVPRHSINLGPPLKVTFHSAVEGRFVATIKAATTFWEGRDDWNEVWMSLEGPGADGRASGYSFPQALDRVVLLEYMSDGRDVGVRSVMLDVQGRIFDHGLTCTERQVDFLIASQAEAQVRGATDFGVLRLLDVWRRDAKRAGRTK